MIGYRKTPTLGVFFKGLSALSQADYVLKLARPRAMKINPDALTVAGYRPYPHHKGKGCTHLFQKTVYAEDRIKLYFINVYLWDFSCFNLNGGKSVEVEVYLFQPGTVSEEEATNLRLTIPVWNPDTDISQVEVVIADTYARLGCIPDIHNN